MTIHEVNGEIVFLTARHYGSRLTLENNELFIEIGSGNRFVLSLVVILKARVASLIPVS